MKNSKKLLALIMALIMTVSISVTASAVAIYPDVDSSSQYATAISMLKLLQVTGGDDNGNFNPNQTITRAEFTKILYVLINGTPDVSVYTGKSVFTDVAMGTWYIGYVNWASSLKIINGKGNNKFAPLDSVTSQEATKMFVIALTGKSTLTWPYGYITEANKANIDLFINAVTGDATKPAHRDYIAQLCYNAIFATDVSTFYVFDSNGLVVARPNAATAVFGLRSLDTTISETSRESWTLSGIKSDNRVALKNENGELVQVISPTSLTNLNVGYTAKIYYLDKNKNNKLDASNDTVLSIVTGNCTTAISKPRNIISINNSYSLTGINFNPDTDLAVGSRLYVMSPMGAVESVVLTPASLVPYLGTLSSGNNTSTGIAADFDVKVIKDNTSGKINAVYVIQPITFAKVTSYDQSTGLIGLDDARFGLKSVAATGQAPNISKVVVAAGVKVGAYATAIPSRDFNGIVWQVKPLLVNSGVTLTAIKSDGTPVFGDTTYTQNILVSDAVTSGKLPGSSALMVSANIGLKFDIYLDTTGNNYLYITLYTGSVTSAENYAFVKSVNTTSVMNVPVYTMTIADSIGQNKVYTLNLDKNGDPSGYLTGDMAKGCKGWTSPDGSYGKIVILEKVVKLTTNSAGQITSIVSMGGVSSAKLSYDSATKILSNNGVVAGTVDETSILFSWNAATSAINLYTTATLKSFTGATALFTVDGLKVKVALFTDMGSSEANTTASISHGAVLSYSTVAGSTLGMVKYVISAVALNTVPVSLTSIDEMSGGPIGTALNLAQSNGSFVDFSLTSGNSVTAVSRNSVTAGTALTAGKAGWFAGTVTAASGGIYQIKGVNIVDGKLASTVGDAITYTLGTAAPIYTVAVAPLTNTLKMGALASDYTITTPFNLIPLSTDIAYIVVYHTSAGNVIDTAFVYTYILI